MATLITPQLSTIQVYRDNSYDSTPGECSEIETVSKDLVSIEPTAGKHDCSSAVKKMAVSNIYFTQATVSPYFSDGTKIADLAQDLASGGISPNVIPSIRVVRYRGRLWTIDNRRLRAFKDGFVDTITVNMVDLKDLGIAKEFWDKKSSKSLIESGVVRNKDFSVSNTQHFKEGIYVFNKHVLNWTFEQIDQPMPGYQKNVLPDFYGNRYEYYTSFETLIFEEARAILRAGVQEVELQQSYPFLFSLIKLKIAKTAENPTEMKFSVLSGSEHNVKAGDALLLEHIDHPQLRLIALASYAPLDPICPQLSFKVFVDREITEEFSNAFEKDQQWKAKGLGSLITLQRMYETCKTSPDRGETILETCIVSGKSPRPVALEEINVSEQQMLSTLNPLQRTAIEEFLQLKEGLYLIQGPPGTGKTTTVIHLLKALQIREEKVLVCAPSNKAVHILAERFIHEFPDVPVILVGIEQKLPPDSNLNRIFMDSWCSQQIQFLMKMSGILWKFQPHKLIEGDVKFLSKRIKRSCQRLEQLSKDFSVFVKDVERYGLSCLEDLQSCQSELHKALCDYCEILSSPRLSASDWKEISQYYAQIDDQTSSLKLPKWVGKARSHLSTVSSILSSLQEKLSKAEIDSSDKGLESELLNHSQIIFSTLSISGQKRLKSIVAIDTLIVDEAGQAIEAETLIPMRVGPKKCLLIGDIQQLPATVISQDAEKLKFGRSMMERLIKDCEQPFLMLKVQYRMHPEISRWPSQKYYRGDLENHKSVCNPQYVVKEMGRNFPFLAPYAFINIDSKEAKGTSGRSFFNIEEAKSTALVIHHLAQEYLIDVETRVAVISFYAAQVNHIYETLKIRYPKIRVNTVDGFQGGESDIVIISCVRANREKQIGFLKEAKRLNVALTRARFSLIIFGNQSTLMRSDIAELVVNANERNLLFQEDVLQNLVRRRVEPSTLTHQWLGQKPSNPRPFTQRVSSNSSNSNYKTQLCRYYALSSCRHGNRCVFAHGKKELRSESVRFEVLSPMGRKKYVKEKLSALMASSATPSEL